MSAYGESRPPPSVVSEAGVTFEPAIWLVTPTFLYWFGRIRAWLTKNAFALGLGGIVLLGAGLRVYALGYQSFWTDEIFSLITTDPAITFREFWDRVFADTHPPIYYVLLRLSSTIIGGSEVAARAPSAFFRCINSLRCRTITRGSPGAQLPSGTLALPRHFTWRRLVCT
jgi:hypothetical protein